MHNIFIQQFLQEHPTNIIEYEEFEMELNSDDNKIDQSPQFTFGINKNQMKIVGNNRQ